MISLYVVSLFRRKKVNDVSTQTDLPLKLHTGTQTYFEPPDDDMSTSVSDIFDLDIDATFFDL